MRTTKAQISLRKPLASFCGCTGRFESYLVASKTGFPLMWRLYLLLYFRPQNLLNGMNKFLQSLDITFRRDPNNFRPRINKLNSVKVQYKRNPTVEIINIGTSEITRFVRKYLRQSPFCQKD